MPLRWGYTNNKLEGIRPDNPVSDKNNPCRETAGMFIEDGLVLMLVFLIGRLDRFHFFLSLGNLTAVANPVFADISLAVHLATIVASNHPNPPR
jgi:hypothetical protein